jgi:N-glycosylase/DNA lyase
LNPAVTPFSLERTLRCGQTFRWEKLGNWWYGVVDGNILKMKQTKDRLQFAAFPKRASMDFVTKYFRLDDDLPHILSTINRDRYMRRAIQGFAGLRLVRQEPWECLVSYICATYKNIPAIKRMIYALAMRLGERLTFNDHEFHIFPKPGDLARASLEDLRACELGFRAPRVLKTARILYEQEFSLDALKEMSYERAKRELLSLPGIGHKVADCVLLFSLDKLEAFPVDVWIKRAMLEFYAGKFQKTFSKPLSGKKSPTPTEYAKFSSFGRKHFGEYAGYAQEYLFAFSRSRGNCHSSSG